jgi:hypothetical protein
LGGMVWYSTERKGERGYKVFASIIEIIGPSSVLGALRQRLFQGPSTGERPWAHAPKSLNRYILKSTVKYNTVLTAHYSKPPHQYPTPLSFHQEY